MWVALSATGFPGAQPNANWEPQDLCGQGTKLMAASLTSGAILDAGHSGIWKQWRLKDWYHSHYFTLTGFQSP